MNRYVQVNGSKVIEVSKVVAINNDNATDTIRIKCEDGEIYDLSINELPIIKRDLIGLFLVKDDEGTTHFTDELYLSQHYRLEE
jgi:hypothetical protein